jgi:hypothetical protein
MRGSKFLSTGESLRSGEDGVMIDLTQNHSASLDVSGIVSCVEESVTPPRELKA